jgi:hypothetical protein
MVLEEYADDALVKDVIVALMKVVRVSVFFKISSIFRSP